MNSHKYYCHLEKLAQYILPAPKTLEKNLARNLNPKSSQVVVQYIGRKQRMRFRESDFDPQYLLSYQYHLMYTAFNPGFKQTTQTTIKQSTPTTIISQLSRRSQIIHNAGKVHNAELEQLERNGNYIGFQTSHFPKKQYKLTWSKNIIKTRTVIYPNKKSDDRYGYT